MTQHLVLSADELQAAARVAGITLPPLLAIGDADQPRVDLAALRGLAARSLVAGLGDGLPQLSGALVDALDVLDAPSLVAEAEVDAGGSPASPPERWTVVVGAGSAVLFSLLAGGLVDVATVGGEQAAVIEAGCRLDAVAEDPPAGEAWETDAGAHAEADGLALDGDRTGAVGVLVCAGVAAEAAGAWVDAVVERRSATALRVARLTGVGGAVEIRDLRWLVDGAGGAWRVDPGTSPVAAGDQERGGGTSVVRPVGAGALRAALDELLQQPRPATVRATRAGAPSATVEEVTPCSV